MAAIYIEFTKPALLMLHFAFTKLTLLISLFLIYIELAKP